MSTARWEQIKRVLEHALSLAPQQRQLYLDIECAGDDELRAEIGSLIASHEAAGSQFLAVAASEILLNPTVTASQATGTPRSRVIGNYQLIEELGHGGMGQVWLAEQTAPVKRRVALKLIKGGMFDSASLKRFQTERQSLALMDHPGIAKVFDAGATADGQPYFVMEYVPGVPITDYCDQKKLRIPERLELFIQVCDGVQHAHQKAIIHRDLKPANILVVEVNGKPLPRIIDFGLAKGAAPDLVGATQFTMLGSFLGTPGYVSPEQADPSTQDVDTRADVYSLGAILYVLLTGSLPFDADEWNKRPFHEALRQLREEDPPRPSTKASRGDESTTATAEVRGTEPKQLASVLRGDLDWIAMKALERDRKRRYPTPSELAVDCGRYLRDEPVQARPASLSYRIGKYVRRHRIGVAVAATLASVLIAFAVLQSLQLRRITRERDRADRIAQFMTDIFKVSDPNERVGSALTAREVLDKAAKDIDTGLAKDPELQARMMHVIGRAYLNLGLYSHAQSLFERAAVNSSVAQQESRETLQTTHDLAWALFQDGHVAEAENLTRRLLDTEQRVLGSDDPDTVGTMGELAFVLCEEGQCAEGVKLNREVLEKQKRTLGPEAFYTLVTMDNLAIMLAESGQPAEAVKLGQEALEIHLRVFGPENLATMNSMTNLASFQRDSGHYEEAEKGFRQALEMEERVLGPDQPETAVTRNDLAGILARGGHKDEALSLLRQAVDHGLPPRIALGMEEDPNLISLRGDPRFAALVAHAKEQAAQKPN